MFGNKKIDTTTTSTVIGEGIKLTNGNIKGKGSIRVDGEIFAEIDIDGNIIVGETGHITGDVKVQHALVAGKIDGNLTCAAGLHLSPTAVLNGNIAAATLIIDEGACFAGNCEMVTSQASNGKKNRHSSTEAS